MKSKINTLILVILGGYILHLATKKPKLKGSVQVGPLRSGFDPEDILTEEEKTMFEL